MIRWLQNVRQHIAQSAPIGHALTLSMSLGLGGILVPSLYSSEAIAGAAFGDRKILAFGDSLTWGIGGAGSTYPDDLAQILNRPVAISANLGETSGQGLQRFEKALNRYDAPIVILCLGTNDLLRGVPENQISENLQQFISIANRYGRRLLIIAVPAVNSAEAHPLFRQLKLNTTTMLDLNALPEILASSLYKSDLVHLNKDGNRELADRISERLKSTGWLEPLE